MLPVIHRFKYYLFFIISFLPLGAFAQSTATNSGITNFFTPPTGDLSVYLLGRVFGVVGNSLHGNGNQLIGILMGIFNAAWVVAIGIGILWVVWSSVISAAGSGEMMGGGKGKKTAFMIIRIVIGFSLVVPSSTTGYSLAQTAVMWIAVQGVGLAGQVSDRFHDYIAQGGTTANTKPSDVEEDLVPVLPMNLGILQSEICMYKLQDISDQENRTNKETQNNLGQVTDVTSPGMPRTDVSVGYSINNDYTISFGTKNPDYNASDENSHMYKSECGLIEFDKTMIQVSKSTRDVKDLADLLGSLDPADPGYGQLKSFYLRVLSMTEGDKKGDYSDSLKAADLQKAALDILLYQQLATTEAILNLQATARAIASIDTSLDPTKPENRSSVFDSLQRQGGSAMAASTMNFATIFDPVRKTYSDTNKGESVQITKELKQKGWLYTPLAILHYGYAGYGISVSKYVPAVSGPKIDAISNISDKNKKSLEQAINLPVIDRYNSWAISYLNAMNQYANLNRVELGGNGAFGMEDSGFLDFLNFNVDLNLGGAVDKVNSACDWVGGAYNDTKDWTKDAINTIKNPSGWF